MTKEISYMEEKLNIEPMAADADTGAELKPCFDEILNDKDYQSEFDRRVAKAIETAKTKWTNEQTDAITSQANERADALEGELEMYRKREKALKLGVAHDMLDYAVYAADKKVDDSTDFDAALNSVISAHSWLTVTTLPTTGIPQEKGIQGKSGVEKAFATLNPRIKF